MERLVYNENTHKLLEESTEKNSFYWRYQNVKYNGLIPVSHKSHERQVHGEEPEWDEEGVSCFDNPYQLMEYVSEDCGIDVKDMGVVLFVGDHKGYGLDEEDIVEVTEESNIYYSMSLLDFYKFCNNADLYWNGEYNIAEQYKSYGKLYTELVK